MLTLRPYQQDAADAVRRVYAGGTRRVLLVMPTGAGKTVFFCWLARATAAKGKRVLVAVHRRELLDQVSDTLDKFGVAHSMDASDGSQVTVATVQTLARRHFLSPDLLVLDEAHHVCAKSWTAVASRCESSYILGVTATPCRMDGRGLANWFDAMVLGPDVETLTRQGYLCPARVFAPPAQVDTRGVKSRHGDYDIRALDERARRITGNVVEHYRALADGRQAVAFCCSVLHCHEVAAALGGEVLHGGLATDARRDIVQRFRDGRLRIVASCDIVSEGFDLPAIGAALLLRPTKSLALHLQQVGRALRPWPGKQDAIILDHAGNTLVHGLPDEPRQWQLTADKQRRQTGLQLRVCRLCFRVSPQGASECIACGAVFAVEPRSKDIKVVDAALVEVTKRERRREVGRAHTRAELEAIAASRGYKRGWVRVMMRVKGIRR